MSASRVSTVAALLFLTLAGLGVVHGDGLAVIGWLIGCAVVSAVLGRPL